MNKVVTVKHKTSVRPDGSLRVQTINDESELTQQQFKDECDINNIVKRHAATGQITHLNGRVGVFADFSSITDYHSMVNTVREADSAFMQLDAHIRARFQNDPGKLLEFIADPSNYNEAVDLGLVNGSKLPVGDNNDDLNDDEKPPVKHTKPHVKTKTASKSGSAVDERE